MKTRLHDRGGMVELRQLRPVQPQREVCEDATVARPAAAPQTEFLTLERWHATARTNYTVLVVFAVPWTISVRAEGHLAF